MAIDRSWVRGAAVEAGWAIGHLPTLSRTREPRPPSPARKGARCRVSELHPAATQPEGSPRNDA